MTREALVATTMVELADSLLDDFDVVDLLTSLSDRCVEVLDVQAAGVMLVSPGGELRVLASSSAVMQGLELFEEQSEEGPCQDCFRTGLPIVNTKLATVEGRWPRFAPRALAAGFQSAHALPMHLRELTIGALNLFRADEGQLDDTDVAIAQGFADVATLAILQHRLSGESRMLSHQLSAALNTRVAIEQAKGVVAERMDLEMDQTFTLLRRHAKRHHMRLADVAREVVDGILPPSELDGST